MSNEEWKPELMKPRVQSPQENEVRMPTPSAEPAPAKELHLMIDLETLGLHPGCSLLSLGAAFFELDPAAPFLGSAVPGPTFTVNIDKHSCMFYGMYEDPNTVKWWEGQSDEAKARLLNPPPVSLHAALHSFFAWIRAHCNPEQVQVWSNGASFDIPLIKDAERRTQLPIPWKYYNERDTRTLLMVLKSAVDPVEFEQIARFEYGTAHSALDDAIKQAMQMQLCWNAIQLQLRS